MEIKGRFNQALNRIQHGGAAVGQAIEVIEHAIHERESIGQGGANHRQGNAVEGLIRQDRLQELHTSPQPRHHIRKAQIAEVEAAAKVRNHHRNGIGLQCPGLNECRQICLKQWVLANNLGRTRTQWIEHRDADFCVGRQGNGTA